MIDRTHDEKIKIHSVILFFVDTYILFFAFEDSIL